MLHRALYLRGDPYETSDAVFGVKESLVVDLHSIDDFPGLAEKHGVPPGTKVLKHDFVLNTAGEARATREREAQREADRQGGKLKVVDGLLVRAEE